MVEEEEEVVEEDEKEESASQNLRALNAGLNSMNVITKTAFHIYVR